jgi:O-antigen/teichoic acid export membrane protein
MPGQLGVKETTVHLQGQPLQKGTVYTGMFRSWLRPLSANSLQLFLNQLLSLVVFLLLAKHLSKHEFGFLNGMLGFFLVAYGILSFGIDQLLMQRTAAGGPRSQLLGSGLIHYLFVAIIFFILLAAAAIFNWVPRGGLLLALALGKTSLFLAQLYKSITTGQERFQRLLAMSILANACKAAGLLLLIYLGHTSLRHVVIVFALAEIMELAACIVIYHRKEPWPNWSSPQKRYRSLLAESMPQLGTVFFAAALARFDWLYLGFRSSASELAEYSFAYKVFELAQLPLLVVAPMLVPRFTRLFQNNESLSPMRRLLFAELVFALFTVAMLNLCWVPLAGWASQGNYGAVNSRTIAWLSAALPVLYYNNWLWSAHFAQGRTTFIFRSFLLTFAVNVLGNLLLVPAWGKEGAAASFLGALVVQTVVYHAKATTVWRVETKQA